MKDTSFACTFSSEETTMSIAILSTGKVLLPPTPCPMAYQAPLAIHRTIICPRERPYLFPIVSAGSLDLRVYRSES